MIGKYETPKKENERLTEKEGLGYKSTKEPEVNGSEFEHL